MKAVEIAPGERRRVEAWLAERGGISWGSGRTFVLGDASRIEAAARLLHPNPGDGHHREHVRELVLAGAPEALPRLAGAVVAGADPALRIEGAAPSGNEALARAFAAAGLGLEARLPAGWIPEAGGRPQDLDWWGRPSAKARRQAPLSRGTPTRQGELRPGPATLAWSDASTAPALARFLATLVPGRAYPAGTLLSEAERLETQRNGAERAPWLVALDASGEVVAGLVLERPPAPERAHVRRVHLDVRPEWRGRGLATELVARALRDPAGRGLLRIEADPLSGNVAVRRALARGGLQDCGSQVGAWRLRGPGVAWDEDTCLASAPAGVESRQVSDGSGTSSGKSGTSAGGASAA